MKNENIKESNKLLVNYIYTLQENIYKSRVEIRNHIIDTDKNNPVNIFPSDMINKIYTENIY